MPLIILILMFLFPHQLLADEKLLKEALKQIPGQSLTLDFVLKAAIKNSSSYRALESTKLESDSLSAQSSVGFDWIVFADYHHLDQDKDTLSPFEPGAIENDRYSLGLRKSFLTGSSFEAKWGRSRNILGFNDPSIQIPSYYEDGVSFNLKQSLWSDFFGLSSRAESTAALKTSESLNLQFYINEQQWAINLIQLFHQAWLNQKSYNASKESFDRRLRLFEVTQSKVRRGTSEKQDLLQVMAARQLSENEVAKSESQLNETWRSLVIKLDLPINWLQIPPFLIPLKMNDISQSAFEKCSQPFKAENTFEVQIAEKKLKAGQLSLQAAENKHKPKLELLAGYSSNGIAVTQMRASNENWDQDHPTWNVGLQLEIPIGDSAARSRLLQARADNLRSTTEYEDTLDNKNIEYRTLCEKLKNARDILKRSELAAKAQAERLELEERRFKLGRTSTFNVIQAGDDKTQSELNLAISSVELQNLSWQVLASLSEFSAIVKNWKEQL